MAIESSLAFWHENLGRFLSNEPPEKSGKASVPTRMKPDADGTPVVKAHTLGAMIDAFYIAHPEQSVLIGKIELPSTDRLLVLPSDGAMPVNPRRFIAEWLIKAGPLPFIVGMIGNASPNATFNVTRHPSAGVWCQSGGGFTFDLSAVRSDFAAIRDILQDKAGWKTLREAILLREAYSLNKPGAKEKMRTTVEKKPEIGKLLNAVSTKPGSGEAVLISWLFQT